MGSFGGRGGEFGGVEDVHGWVISVCVCTHLQYESRVRGVGTTMHEDIFWITCTVHTQQRYTKDLFIFIFYPEILS